MGVIKFVLVITDLIVVGAIPWGRPCQVPFGTCEGGGIECRELWAPDLVKRCIYERSSIAVGGDCKFSEECMSENCQGGKCKSNGAPPISHDQAYNQSAALTYLHYARASWCDATVLKTWSCGESCKKAPVVKGSVHVFGPGKKGGVKGYVAAQMPGQCIVAFRGSCNFLNGIADLDAFKTTWKTSWCLGCEVHAGFLQAFLELRDDMLKGLQKNDCQTVAVTGHSLGAAVGALAAMQLRGEQKIHVEPVYLSGCPRVGTQAFVNAFIKLGNEQKVAPPAWRVVHWLDPVPRIPTEGMGFRHFPQEVYYDEECSSYQVCDLQNGEDHRCSSGASIFHAHNAADHTTYLNQSLRVTEMPKACIADPGIVPLCRAALTYI